MLDPVILGRLQFASTTIFHYFFVPVSIGLAFIIAIMQTFYVVKGDDVYKKMTKFWGTLFLINFVTGILQEFQFGMNWSTYSRFVGDVFGPSLAIEGLLAFFLESTFIGIWIFGWNRLPKKVHLLSIWLVSIGTILSAFWILSANSFMQNPVGFEIVDGRAQMNDFVAILTNPHLWSQFPHVIITSLLTGSFLVAGISAWKLYKKQNVEMFKRSFTISIILGFVTSFTVLFTGHWQAQYLIEAQPMKLAAAEALWENSGDPAPFTVFAVIDTENKENKFEIQIPYLLSFLSYEKFSGSVTGINELQAYYEEKYGPGDYIPPVKTLFWVFRIMTGAGLLMLLLSMYGVHLRSKDKESEKPLFLKLMTFAIALPFIANTSGWLMTELGRQPWIVFGLLTVEDAISPNVSAGEVLFSMIAFTAIYTILAIVTIYLFVRHIKKTDHDQERKEEVSSDPFDKAGGAEVVS